jgi:hypothetical protein
VAGGELELPDGHGALNAVSSWRTKRAGTGHTINPTPLMKTSTSRLILLAGLVYLMTGCANLTYDPASKTTGVPPDGPAPIRSVPGYDNPENRKSYEATPR